MKNNEPKSNLKDAVTYLGIGFLFLCVVLSGAGYYKSYLDQEEKKESAQKELAKAIAEAKATSAYKLACLDAGIELDVSAPEVLETARILFKGAKFFHTTEDKIADIAYYHVSEVRKRDIKVSANALILAGIEAFSGLKSVENPSIETFNLFGAMYQSFSKP